MGLQFATIVSVIAVIAGTQGAFLFGLWFTDRRLVSLNWWAAAFGILMLGCSLAVWQSFGGPTLFGLVGATLIVLAFGLIWQAVRVFDGRSPIWPVLVSLPLAWFAFVFLAADLLEPRLAVISAAALVCVFLVMALREVVRGRREALNSRQPLAASLGVVLASVLLQMVFDLGPGMNEQAASSLPYGVWLMLAGAIAVSTAAALALGMARERQQSMREVLAALDPQTGALSLGAFLGQAARLVAAQLKVQAPVTFVMVQLDCEPETEAAEARLLDFHDSFMAHSRATDMVARVRSTAFAVIMLNVEPEEALKKIRLVMEDSIRPAGARDGRDGLIPRARVSLVSTSEVGHDLRALMLAAETAMEETRYATTDAFVIYSVQRQSLRRDTAAWRENLILGA